MRSRNKFPIILIAIISFCFLTGFTEVDYYIDVAEDETTKLKLVVQVDKKYSEAQILEYIDEHFFLNFEESAFTKYEYTFAEENQRRVMIVDVHYDYFSSTFDINHFHAFNILGNSGGHTRTFPFYKKAEIEAVMEIPEDSIKGNVNHGYINEEEVDVQVHLSLPFTVKNHNGSYDGKEIVWTLDPVRNNHLQVTYVNNELYKPVIYVGAAVLFIWMIRIRKKKHMDLK
ncbi:LppM family (lipo)protein [Pseudalkalibacillus sp. Hm43]|uniref:LppM family (lipo)protein n=1 Tax=Pseudalkalibacillus sp. Hm43 TaxID=3450742 RepID=UPI003F4254EC